uniref:RNA-dependent RNA polymerase n=1 Tax=Riboviria sp. TaxID=2585031 RepID=A0A514DB05_9VIRU|nr:MAG: RNA-dependent RNA polymerase [Riboviria sp.]
MNASISKAPDHPSLRVERLLGKKPKRVKKPTDIIAMRPPVEFVVHNHCINTLERAAKERLLYVSDGKGGFVEPPKPASQTFFNSYCRKFSEEFSKHVTYTAPLTKTEFLGAYDGRRRTLYEKAFESLKNRPLSIVDSFVSFFLKTEKVNRTAKPDPAPRGISPRTPRYHVSLGPYIKKIEHIVYKIIAVMFGAPTVFKGLNASARGKQLLAHWNHFDDPVAIGLDASRFDQHVSLECLVWEHSIYKLFFRKDKYLERLLKWQLHNTGYGYEVDGKLKFELNQGVVTSANLKVSGQLTSMAILI